MKLTIMDIPETSADLPGWLERQMTGARLGELVDELSVVHGEEDRPRSLEQVMGEELESVIDRGLGVLPRETIRVLLRQPQLLLDLQERVLEAASPYWDHLTDSPELAKEVKTGRTRLMATLEEPARQTAHRPFRRRLPFWISMMAAAAVLAIVTILPWLKISGEHKPSWGWGKEGGLARADQAGTPSAYLTILAEEAGEFKDVKTANREELSRGLQDWLRNCDALVAAEHKPLAEPDGAWLRERCQAWKKKFEAQLVELADGADIDKVRKEATETVNNLVTALKKRAEQTAAQG